MGYKHLVDQLTLEQKVKVLTGEDFWTTWEIPEIGLRKIVVSDGPSGVRGELWDERSDSLSLPSASAFASTWNRDLLKFIGQIMASEARRKNVDVVLGPTINLHRSPLGGRHFEAYSEDSVLSGNLASAFITGIQGEGVGGCLKHFVANDAETDRHTVNNVIDEKTLREIYALPFEIAVRDSHPWTVMSAYNRVNGPKMAASPLLNSVLKEEWQWDGLVVSDWTGVQSTIDTGNEGNDLEMPGPFGFWGEQLVEAVRKGEVTEAAIDAKLERLLTLAERVGKLGSAQPSSEKKFSEDELRKAARDIGAESIVLVKNKNSVLPLENVQKIAVIGSHAKFGRGQGGGSATVFPKRVISPLEGLLDACENNLEISYTPGCPPNVGLIHFDKNYVLNPRDLTPGCLIEVYAEDGSILFTEDRYGGFFNWATQPWMFTYSFIRASAIFTAQQDGIYEFGIGMVGNFTVTIGEEVHKGNIPINSDDLAEYILNPPSCSFPYKMKKGEQVSLAWEYPRDSLPIPVASFYIGFREPSNSANEELEIAKKIAAESDISIVFVGTTPEIESEGHDRKDLKLPDGQDLLVQQIAKISKKTVVVVNAGSPVEMPWFNDVDSVLLAYFGGQEMGNAIADVIFGRVNPSACVPTTWAKAISEVPVLNTTPSNGILAYEEGPFIGYRIWQKNGLTPLIPFGFGLSYTTFKMEILSANLNSAKIGVTNTGKQSGSKVVQLYSRAKNSERFTTRLCGFGKIHLHPGESKEIDIQLEPLVFSEFERGWKLIKGEWELILAENAYDEIAQTTIVIA